MIVPAPISTNGETPELLGVSFGRSADGFCVALVGETAFAMKQRWNGGHFLASAWRLGKPMAEWMSDDFYAHHDQLADEAAFRHAVLENAEHQREKKALGRRDIRTGANTPWGPSQGGTLYADDVVFHSTAGHGGFHLSAARNAAVHPLLKVASGWYEEDEAWAIVAIAFPHLFTGFERRCAERTVKDSWPDAWETMFGTILAPGESRERDRRAFERAHANDWIVIAAITSDREQGFVECIATRGGKRGPSAEERRFLVPTDEYRIGRFGFVIDEARHRSYDGPSTFVASREKRWT